MGEKAKSVPMANESRPVLELLEDARILLDFPEAVEAIMGIMSAGYMRKRDLISKMEDLGYWGIILIATNAVYELNRNYGYNIGRDFSRDAAQRPFMAMITRVDFLIKGIEEVFFPTEGSAEVMRCTTSGKPLMSLILRQLSFGENINIHFIYMNIYFVYRTELKMDKKGNPVIRID